MKGITIVSKFTAFSMTILTIVLTITGILGQGGDLAFSGFSPQKDERVLKKC